MKIFGFVKKVLFVRLTMLSSFGSINWLSCISMSNQECKVRPKVVNVNGDEPVIIQCQELMKQDTNNEPKRVNVSVNLGLMFVIKNNVGIKINADVNAKK